jgi:signal transduction histidine kinase
VNHEFNLHAADVRAMQQLAHKVLDQLTAVSGHAQMALLRAKNTCVREELDKIRTAADRAVAMVRLSLVHLKEIEETRS